MTNEILKINDLNKSFAKRKVINKLDLTVSRGDIYGFIRANGQGKTTTIRMITGLVFPDSGEILINGKSVFNEKKTSLKNLGAMVEAPRFYENLSGYENLKLMANLIDNVGEKEIQEVLELVHLSDKQKDKFSNYSMGMKQRLGIANALLGNPDLIILDEPTNGLDPNGMEEINELIIYLAKTFQKTFLYPPIFFTRWKGYAMQDRN